jgi:hypothetical protein
MIDLFAHFAVTGDAIRTVEQFEVELGIRELLIPTVAGDPPGEQVDEDARAGPRRETPSTRRSSRASSSVARCTGANPAARTARCRGREG